MAKAILKTRCGCQREMEVPFPPNVKIILPLTPDLTAVCPEGSVSEDIIHIRTRQFDLHGIEKDGPYGIYHYYERLEQ